MGGERRTSEIACVVVSGWFEGKVEDSEGSPERGCSVRSGRGVDEQGCLGLVWELSRVGGWLFVEKR